MLGRVALAFVKLGHFELMLNFLNEEDFAVLLKEFSLYLCEK